VNSPENDEIQTAYHILVASTADKLAANTGDLWDSGRVESSQSVAVEYKGAPLYAGKSYWWKVRTFVKSDSPAQWSEPQQFHMQGQDNENSTVKDALPDRYLPVREERKPVKFLKVADGHAYYDFGTVTLNINSPIDTEINVHLGEERAPDGERVNRKPGGTRRYCVMSVPVKKDPGSYTVEITPDGRNTGNAAIKMPASIGEVMPFRYCEISDCPADLTIDSVVMVAMNYPFDDDAASFTSSDETLNAVWELSKYSIKATSFCGVYVDGEGSKHASLHANMWPLAFGLVPPDRMASVTEFVKSRKMACSVYGAQYLMDALYLAGEDDYALSLMNSKEKRSWWNMIAEGSTITMEAWGNQFKGNQDWNHAWGAVPANIIPRRLMGVTPLEPGFGRIQIKPQVGSLSSASLKTPTIRGPVYVTFNQQTEGAISLTVKIPANTTTDVYVPIRGGNKIVHLNGKQAEGKVDGEFLLVSGVGSGEHRIQTSKP